jgi:predicted lipoprotein with Yx(FWY)xxD motif
MMKTIVFTSKRGSLATLSMLVLLLLAACTPAGGSPYGAAPTATKPASPAAGQAGTAQSVPVTGAVAIKTADNSKLGKILVDSMGMTLYYFEIDTPTESKCVASDCVSFWPPLTVTGDPQASADVTGKLTTIARPDGSKQVVLEGHPLYRFTGDQKPGDTSGHGLNVNGGEWYALTSTGKEAGSKASVDQPASASLYPKY